MTPYRIFSIWQKCRRYNPGTIKKFEESENYQFYYSLCYYFREKLKITSDLKIAQFIEVCARETGARFNPFELTSLEYLEIFKEWFLKNSNKGAYLMNVNESFKKIYKFCSDKNIVSLEEYTKKWGVSHLVSGILNENVAYVLGVHKLTLTKPEVTMINKKFLKHLKSIEERINRENNLKKVLSEGIEDIKNKLIWRNEKV